MLNLAASSFCCCCCLQDLRAFLEQRAQGLQGFYQQRLLLVNSQLPCLNVLLLLLLLILPAGPASILRTACAGPAGLLPSFRPADDDCYTSLLIVLLLLLLAGPAGVLGAACAGPAGL
jgi:hypothetical protein